MLTANVGQGQAVAGCGKASASAARSSVLSSAPPTKIAPIHGGRSWAACAARDAREVGTGDGQDGGRVGPVRAGWPGQGNADGLRAQRSEMEAISRSGSGGHDLRVRASSDDHQLIRPPGLDADLVHGPVALLSAGTGTPATRTVGVAPTPRRRPAPTAYGGQRLLRPSPRQFAKGWAGRPAFASEGAEFGVTSPALPLQGWPSPARACTPGTGRSRRSPTPQPPGSSSASSRPDRGSSSAGA